MKASRGWRRFIICVVLVAFGFYVAFICVPAMVQRARNEHDIPLCGEHMRRLHHALFAYAQDHSGRLPTANVWCDQIVPYVKDRSAFVCSGARNQICSYALNKAAAGKRITDLHDPWNLVLLFESDKGWNATGGPDLLPLNPRHQPFYENVLLVSGDIRMGYRQRDASGRPLRKYGINDCVWSLQAHSTLREP